MGKIKVKEIADKMKVESSKVIEQLKKLGVEVKTASSSVDEEVINNIMGIIKNEDKNVVKTSPKENNPHIIRRQVRVVSKDEKGNEIENITTKAGSKIEKKSFVHKNETEPSYNKEGLGVVVSNYSQTHNNNFNNRKSGPNSIVVTRSGKQEDVKIEKDIEGIKEVENKQIEKPREENTNNNIRSDDTRPPYNRDNNTTNNGGGYNNTRPPYNRDNNTTNNAGGYNNRPAYNNTRPPYNRDNNTTNNGGGYNNTRPPYNRDNNTTNNTGGYNNRPAYNNTRPPYNRDNNTTNNAGGYNNRPPYNRDNNTTNNGGGYNNTRPPYNRDNNTTNNAGGYNNRPAYNNNNNTGGYSRPYNNNGGYNNRPGYNNQGDKVNQFIKETTPETEIQKTSRDYSLSLIDKKKQSVEKNAMEAKKDKLNKNQLREEDTRLDFNKFKGLEVDSSSGLLDFYDRGEGFKRGSKKRKTFIKPIMQQTKIIPLTEVTLPELMTVKYFSESIKKQSSEIIKKLFGLGVMATVNKEIDFDTAFLIAEELGIKAIKQVVITEEDVLFDDEEDCEELMCSRPPIVTVMGHVDHGKTSLLDRIRKADVVSNEAGGITQHIGAYKVKIHDKEITFLDTPGHAAFTEMRARGAEVTDIVVIVVAADDGIMPQTKEAINHAKAAGVKIIVAINKIDKPSANIDKVKQELLEAELVPEEWGGDTIIAPVSAITGEGIEHLLEMILLVAEVEHYRANPNKQSKGTVIEARLDKARGTIASVIVQRGQLNVGDTIVVGDMIGKIRSMRNDKGEKVKFAGPSTPVEILGLSNVPVSGDVFYEVKDEKTAKALIAKRKATQRKDLIKHGTEITLDDLFGKIKDGELKDLNIILKGDVQGSVGALKDSLEKLSNEEVRVRVIHSAAGGITESDVTLAKVSKSIIIGFNVRPDPIAATIAEKEKVDLRLYRVIYDAINDVESAMKGMLAPTFKEIVHGTAEVRLVFKATNIGTIAGSHVKSGKIVRNTKVRIIRDSIVIFEGNIQSLKREKDDTKEVAEGYECGIKIEGYDDIKELDMIECFEIVEEKKG